MTKSLIPGYEFQETLSTRGMLPCGLYYKARITLFDWVYTVENVEFSGMVTTKSLREFSARGIIRGSLRELVSGDMSVLKVEMSPMGISDAAIRRTAVIYQLAVITSFRPAKLVSETLGISISTAGNWIRNAKLNGYISSDFIGLP